MNGFEIFMTGLFVVSWIVAVVVLILMGIYHYRFHYACLFCHKCYNTGTDWIENRIMHLLQTILAVAMCIMAFYFWLFCDWEWWKCCLFGFIAPWIVTLLWEGVIMILVAFIGSQHEYNN